MAKPKRKKIHEALYYLTVLITIIFISAMLFFISPILFFGHYFYVYIVLMTIGVTLGAFLKGFLKDLDELTHKHHAGLIIIVLIAAMLNFVSLTTALTIHINKSIHFSILSALIFTISFLIPYAYHYYKKER
ncbi:hypothetical protein KO361_05555 [Candidatus Woesearchaeota archaeon]|nr:hypothetical protein [Candidatus Woesearchaeota archaeon]